MLPRFSLGLLVTVLTGLSLRAVAGHDRWSGRPLVGFTDNHGIDEGDLLVVALWFLGIVCVWIVWRRLLR